jgi:hypothetical protein
MYLINKTLNSSLYVTEDSQGIKSDCGAISFCRGVLFPARKWTQGYKGFPRTVFGFLLPNSSESQEVGRFVTLSQNKKGTTEEFFYLKDTRI